ncbi:MAG: TlpA family protein disulfide reductase [Nitrospirae bacterium]|nr:MAG: TlpA family protein disulfide reductase [Nitrospirota bacterium]
MIGLALLLLGGCDAGYSSDRPAPPRADLTRETRPTLHKPVPDFSLVDLKGNRVSLGDFRGKVVVLNFWATWCGPCKVEMPAMEALYRDLHPEGLVILAVSIDPQGAVVTRPFQQAWGLTFPILHDPDYRVGSLYGARTLPMTFVIDRRGVLRHRIFGARDWNSAEARSLIHSLLAER